MSYQIANVERLSKLKPTKGLKRGDRVRAMTALPPVCSPFPKFAYVTGVVLLVEGDAKLATLLVDAKSDRCPKATWEVSVWLKGARKLRRKR